MKTTTVIAAFALALAAGASHVALAQDNNNPDNRPHGRNGEHVDPGGVPRGPTAGPLQRPPAAPRPAPAAASPAVQPPPAARAERPAGYGGQDPRADGYRGQDHGSDGYRGQDHRNDGYRGQDHRSDGYRGDDRRTEDHRGGPRPEDRWQDRGDRGDGRFQGGPPRTDGRWDQRRDGAERHWERGRYPPVYQSDRRFRTEPYRYPRGYYARSWRFGDVLPRAWFGPDYLLDDVYGYGLPYPPPGYEWVRVGPDALMIDRYTGRIVQVVRYVFW